MDKSISVTSVQLTQRRVIPMPIVIQVSAGDMLAQEIEISTNGADKNVAIEHNKASALLLIFR